jgi:MFS family permease
LGAAFIFSTGLAILASAFPKEGRGKALGYTTAATYTGLSAGPVLGGMITYYAGWQMIFLATAPLALLVSAAAYRFLNQEIAPAHGESYDKIGAVLYFMGLILSMYGLSFVVNDLSARLMLAAGLLILCLFVYYEFRCAYPLVDVKLFKENITFAFSNMAAMINYSATFAVGFLVSLYLQIVQGFDPRVTGWILMSQPLLMALFSPFAGRLSDKIEPRLVASAGMGLTGLGLFGFSFMDQSTNLFWIIANLALMGLGFAFFSSPNNNAIMGSIGKEKYGLAASSLATMRMVGQALSMALTALILACYGGSSGMLPAAAPMLLQSIQTSMLLFTGLSAVAIVFSLKRGRLRPDLGLKG